MEATFVYFNILAFMQNFSKNSGQYVFFNSQNKLLTNIFALTLKIKYNMELNKITCVFKGYWSSGFNK